jgi:hypothetical protein
MARKLTTRAARKMAAARQNFKGGRPRVMRPCEKCGIELSARQLLAHECSLKKRG